MFGFAAHMWGTAEEQGDEGRGVRLEIGVWEGDTIKSAFSAGRGMSGWEESCVQTRRSAISWAVRDMIAG